MDFLYTNLIYDFFINSNLAIKTNGIFSKYGNIVVVALDGLAGDELPNSIPDGFRPRYHTRIIVMGYSQFSNGRFIGSIQCTPSGGLDGSLITYYGQVDAENIRQSKFGLYGSAAWIA